MKALQEFASVSSNIPENGDQLKLYRLAINGLSREEAKIQLGVSDKYFNNIYYQLKDYMMSGVLNHSLSDLTPWQRIQCSIRRNYETAIKLLLLDKKVAGVPLARTTLRKAEKYGLFQVALDLCRSLVGIYGSINVNSKQYRFYAERLNYYMGELQLEVQAETLFYRYIHKHLTGGFMQGVEEELDKFDQVNSNSHRFHYMRLICRVMHQQIVRQDKAMIDTCKEAIELFRQYKHVPYILRFSFYYRLVAGHLAHGEFAQAEIILNQSLKDPKRGGTNWQILMLHRALLGFHSGKAAIAVDSYQKAMKVPRKLRTEQIQERWRIIRAYLELFDRGTGTWRLTKFLNSFPYSQSDKSGPILSVHIAELLHLLKQNKFEAYRYRCERMTAYIDRYLNKKKELVRFVHFFRLLQCVVRGGFRRTEAAKKGKIYLNKLHSSTPRIGADVREVEVVPFERLWEMALGWLK
ncbi:MAG: hypothetical protein AAFZ15_04285 [Bacteroidota bacterium]